MANRKISQLTALTTPAAGDYLPIVDISEAADADKNKRITIEELLRGAPDGTAAAPSIAFESDPDSGLYSTGANGLALATGGVGRLFVESSGATRIEGTGGPSLIIKDTDSLSGSSTSYLRFWASDAETGYIGYVGGSNYFINNSRSGGAILLRTEDTERLRITNTGQLSHIGGGTSGSPAVSFNGSAPSNSLVVDSSGRVSIGAASASRTLELHSTVPVLRLIDTDASGTPRAEIGAAGGNLTFAADQGSSGTGGNVIFYAPGATERLRITSDGKLGLGTTSAVAPLTVVAASNNTDIAVFNGSTGTSRGLKLSTGVNFNSDALVIYDAQEATYGSHLFRTRGTNALFIDQSQRVGIGTTSPAAGFGTGIVSLDVNGPIFARGPIASNQTNAGVIQYTANDTTIRSFGATAGTGAIAFKVGGGGGSADTEAARITSDGKLGLGTSSPAVTAHISSSSAESLRIEHATSPYISWYLGATRGAYLLANSSYVKLGADAGSNNTIQFSNSGGDRLTINSAGNVGIGTTSPGYTLDVAGTVNANATFRANDGTHIGIFGSQAFASGVVGLGSGSNHPLVFGTNANERARIDSNGTFRVKGAGAGGATDAVQLSGAAPSSSLVVDSSGRLGVGTGSPLAELHLNDSTGLSRMRFTGGAAGADNFEIGQAIVGVSNSGFSIYDIDATATRFVIDSSGNVGIGTASPSENLHVKVASTDGIKIQSDSTTAGTYSQLGFLASTNDAGAPGLAIRGYRGTDFNSGYLTFNTGGATVQERLRIDGSGYLRMASGSGGIQFNGDTAAANALDDYEEGTYTMTLYDDVTGGNASPTTATVKYTKIGRLVHVYGLGVSNIDTTGMTAGNNLYVSLPFTIGEGYSGGEARLLGAALPSSGQSTNATLGAGSAARFSVGVFSNAGGVAAATVGDLTSGVSDLRYISIVYQAA